MKKQFNTFNSNIRLTPNQEDDAKTKYDGVCKTLHNYYYEPKYNGSTKFLFGSYKKKTNIRPITEFQDVDVIFFMPESEFERYDNYEGNGQSALLQKIKNILEDTYTTTDKIKGWGKVVLVKFVNNKHNVEVMPAWENSDGTFTIPNSEDGGSWETFDPRSDIDVFQKSNKKTSGQTAILSRMMKTWKSNTSSLSLKSFEIEIHVINFLYYNYDEDKELSIISRDFFKYLEDEVDSYNKSFVQTALKRSTKAVDFEKDEKYDKSCDEWKKIYGEQFPKWTRSIKIKATDESYSRYEKYIEDMFKQDLNLGYRVKIECEVEQDGYRRKKLIELLSVGILKPSKKLHFNIKSHNVSEPYEVYWKVRNFGQAAKEDLRGEIRKDKGFETKTEHTRYRGSHYVECYIIKDKVCVARDRIDIPISLE